MYGNALGGAYISEVNTNGSFMTAELLEEWKSLGMDTEFKISYDGVRHHDWLCNVPGAEEKELRGIRLCKEHGFRVRAQTNVHRGNLDTMFDTVKLLDSLGVEKVRIIRTTETPRWDRNGQRLCLEIGEYYDEMLKLMGRLVKTEFPIQVDIWQVAYYHPRTKRCYFHPVVEECGHYRDSPPLCRGTRGTIAVAHTGEVYPCNQMSGTLAKWGVKLGNVKKRPLHELLSQGEYLDLVTTPVSAVKGKNAVCREGQY